MEKRSRKDLITIKCYHIYIIAQIWLQIKCYFYVSIMSTEINSYRK